MPRSAPPLMKRQQRMEHPPAKTWGKRSSHGARRTEVQPRWEIVRSFFLNSTCTGRVTQPLHTRHLPRRKPAWARTESCTQTGGHSGPVPKGPALEPTRRLQAGEQIHQLIVRLLTVRLVHPCQGGVLGNKRERAVSTQHPDRSISD